MIEIIGKNKEKYVIRTQGIESEKLYEITKERLAELKNEQQIKDSRSEVTEQLNKFKKSAELVALKLFLLNGSTSYEYKDLFFRIADAAKVAGLILYSEQISVDDENKGIYFKNLGKIVTFDTDKIQTNSNTVTDLVDKDVLDADVAKLSRFGLAALEHMTLKIGSNVVTVADLLLFMEKMLSTDLSHVMYIGITPSNRMFKFAVGTKWNVDCYSVCFSDEETFVTKYNANKLINSKSVYDYRNYVRNVSTGMPFYCIKFSYKDYSGFQSDIRSFLKNKYKTLHDVYIGESCV